MKKYLVSAFFTLFALMCGAPAYAASPAFVSDTVIVTQGSQGIIGWAALVTDTGGASANINDLTPTLITCVTAFSPDYIGTAKVFSVNLFLTSAGAATYLAAHPGAVVGWYAPSTRN